MTLTEQLAQNLEIAACIEKVMELAEVFAGAALAGRRADVEEDELRQAILAAVVAGYVAALTNERLIELLHLAHSCYWPHDDPETIYCPAHELLAEIEAAQREEG